MRVYIPKAFVTECTFEHALVYMQICNIQDPVRVSFFKYLCLFFHLHIFLPIHVLYCLIIVEYELQWLFKSTVYKFSFKFRKANVLQEIVTRVKVQYTVEVKSLLLQYYTGNSLFKSILLGLYTWTSHIAYKSVISLLGQSW